MKKSALVFIALTGFASFCNYAVYPALSRVLLPSQFIDITVALTLFTQLSSYMLAVVALTIGLTKESGNAGNSKTTIEKLQTILSHMFLLILGVFLVLSPFIIDSLKLPAALLLPICLMLGLSLVMSVLSGYLNGKQELNKLGIILAGSSLVQLIASVAVGLITKSGILALLAMALAALASTAAVYIICRKENLPNILSIFVHGTKIYKVKSDRKLFKYTVASSIAALVINILLVLDLLIITSRGEDALIYADMYVISRIVFFAGMLFVWPFLSEIDLKNRILNLKRFGVLIGIFLSITIVAILTMLYFDQVALDILLGSSYKDPRISTIAVLSILYKFIYLILITLCLLFMVFRSYWAVAVPILVTFISVPIVLISSDWNTVSVVSWLSFASGIGVVVGLVGLWHLTTRLQQ